MALDFDDLIPPTKNAGVEFDDLIPAKQGNAFADTARDIAAGLLKIGPVAAKGAGDITQLVTGGKFGSGLSDSMQTGMQAIDDVVASDRLRNQKAAFNAVMNDPNQGVMDVLGAAVDNPRATLDAGISTIGSMLLPAGAAGTAVKLGAKGLGATAATVGTGAIMNAADTFTEIDSPELSDKYQGAAISGATSLGIGALTGGGVDGLVAKRLAGEVQKNPTFARAIASIFGSTAKEGVQEAVEEAGNYTGQAIGEGAPIDTNQLAKQSAYGGALGAVMGGGIGAVNQALPQPAPMQVQPEAQAAAPAVSFDDLIPAAKEPINESTDALAPNGAPDPVLPNRADPDATLAAPVPVPVGPLPESPNTVAGQEQAPVPVAVPDLPTAQDSAPRPASNATGPVLPDAASGNTQGLASSSPVNPVQTDAIATSSQAEGGQSPVTLRSVSGQSPVDNMPQQATAEDNSPAPSFQAPNAIDTEVARQVEAAAAGMKPGDIARADGKAFKTKPEALKHAKQAGKGWRAVKGGGGYVVRHYAPSANQIANAKARQRDMTVVNPERDSLFAAIAKLGGIHPDQLTKQWGFDPEEVATVRGAGIKRVANKNGLKLDRMAEGLAELGYLSYDENGRHDLEEFFELFDGELRGAKHYTPIGFENVARAQQEQEWLSQQDAQALDALPEDGQDNIEGQLDDYETASEQDEADLRASLDRANGEVNDDARAEEGNDGTADQADPGKEIGASAAERPGDAQRGPGTAGAQGRRSIKQEMAEGPIDSDPDADIPFDATDSRLKTEPRSAADTARDRAKQQRMAVQRRYEQDADANERDFQLRKIQKELDAELQATEGFGDVPFSRAYHGSPHRFDKFSLDHMGNGEGAQAYGWGLYFTAKRDIAEYYRQSLAGQKLIGVVGKKYGTSQAEAEADARRFLVMSRLEPKQFASYDDGGQSYIGKIVRDIKRGVIKADEGQLYEVEIPDDHEYLLWDKPLSEQRANIKAALVKLAEQYGYEYADTYSGGEFYRALTSDVNAEGMNGDRPADQAASELLHAVGIGGIKYLDGTSRDSKGDGYNYVVFDDSRISIEKTHYSKKKTRYAGMTVEQVKTAIASDTFGHDVDVYATMDEAPDYIRMQASREDGGDVEGYWDIVRNRVVLIAENLDSPERAREVARHELIGHYGLENMLADSADPDAMGKLVKRVLKAESDGNTVIADLAAQVDRTQPGLSDTRRAKEIIAIMAERNIQNSITKRVYDLIRKFFKKIGFLKSDITDAKIADLLRDAQKYLQANNRGTLANPEAAFSRMGEAAVLDANKPIADQLETVRRAVKSEMRRIRNESGEFDNQVEDTLTGQDLIERITERLGSESEAHAYLESIGIHGIKQGSETIDLQEMAFSRGDVAEGLVDTNSRGEKIAYVRANLENFWNWYGDGKTDDQGRPVVDGHLYTNDKGQKKSVNNIGTYNPKEGSTLYSRKADSAFDVTNPGVLDNLTRAMQDNKIDLKRVQQAITEQGGQITESEDAYLNEELYIGKVSAQFDKLNERRVTPLIEAINTSDLTPEEVNDFLYARHAPEANARLRTLNPGKNNDALSGMTDEKAAQIIAGFKSSGKYDKLVKIAGIVDTITKETRRRIVANGLETADMIAKWEGAYQHYVPLKADDDIAIGMKNSGFTVRGAESKRRMGQTNEARNILANVIAQAQSSIKRAEKAKVGRSLLDLARAHPNKDFWTVDKPVRKRDINKETGLMEWVVDPNFKEADNVLVVKENGEDHFIVFKERDANGRKNERGMRIAAAMKNLDAAQLPWLAEATGKFTRHLAQWITARNPLFWVTNFARDVQGAAFNLQNTPIAGKEAAVMAAIPKAMAGYWKITRGDGSGQWAEYAKEFKAAGAETGFIKVFETADDHMADLEAQFKQMQEGKANPKKLARALVTAIDDYNTVIENGVRLAVYQTGRENGLSIRKAASLAKNITVNFNRKGNQSTFFNSLYMFMNASIQGNVRFLTAVATSKRAQVVAGSLVGIGFLLDAVNRSIGGDDEETGKAKYDLIPEFERERNWIFMDPTSSGKYIKIPMPYGPHIAMNMGRMLSDSIFGEKADPIEKALSMARITVDAFNPLGSNGSFGQLIAPSVVKPIVQISENKAFHGGPAYKEAFGFGYEAPAYTRHFKSTGEHWVDASKLLNDVSGGDSIAPGKLDVPPEVLRTLFLSYVAPGLMQTADKTLDTSTRAAKGEKIEPSQVPALSRFYGEAPEERAQERAYYEKQRAIKQSIEQVKKYAKDGNRDGMNRTLEELGDGDIQQGKRIKAKWEATEKQLTRIQSAKRKIEQDKVEDDRQAAQLDRLDEKRMALIKKMLR